MKLNKNLSDREILLSIYQTYFDSVYNRLKNAKQFYPEFQDWYYSKVIPDILNNEREFIFENRDDKIVGLSLIKYEEKKLCTLKVFEEYQNNGFGLKLFEKSFEKLNTNKPFLTVSEENYNQFKKIFNYYNFELTSVKYGYYRSGKVEYFFNEN
jgi:ribosomal protein S18 acetylase RimI-like enzyme